MSIGTDRMAQGQATMVSSIQKRWSDVWFLVLLVVAGLTFWIYLVKGNEGATVYTI